VALEQYWVSNNPSEGKRWLTELLARGDEVTPESRVRALRALGGTVYIAGDFEEGTRYHEQALVEYRLLGDEFGIGHILFRLAVEAHRAGDSKKALALCEESRALHRGRSKWAEAQAASLLGTLAFEDDRHQEAFELLDQSAELAEEAGFRWWRTHALLTAAEYALKLNRPDQARARTLEGLSIARAMTDRQSITYGLALLAWAAVAEGKSERAGRLWGAIEAEEEHARIGQWESERESYAQRILVGSGPDFDRGRAEGRSLSLDEAVDYALSAVD
jgi:tetratricopeptide (TPR) repeat protein